MRKKADYIIVDVSMAFGKKDIMIVVIKHYFFVWCTAFVNQCIECTIIANRIITRVNGKDWACYV